MKTRVNMNDTNTDTDRISDVVAKLIELFCSSLTQQDSKEEGMTRRNDHRAWRQGISSLKKTFAQNSSAFVSLLYWRTCSEKKMREKEAFCSINSYWNKIHVK